MAKIKKPIVVLIRDGWGFRKSHKLNAVFEGKTLYTDFLMKKYPNSLIKASGNAVGLPTGYQGNSEVGHLTIGSGRIINQSLERINKSIKSKSFFKNKTLLDTINNCKKYNSKLHIIGLIQSQGVHSHSDHLYAILDACKKEKFGDVLIHVITDGRDSPVTESIKHINNLNKTIKKYGFGKIVTLSGRYYAMDRDKRWNRTKKAYDCIVNGKANCFDDVLKQIKTNHKNKETDEFMVPKKSIDYRGFSKNDSVLLFNFRTDRLRQLTQAIFDEKFPGWVRKKSKVFCSTMTKYYQSCKAKVMFENIEIKNILGDVLSKKNKKQLRISETEKYAHVTFFFNGQIEKPFKGEDRILIESPKVKTYDLMPEMSSAEISEKLCKAIDKNKYDVIITNIVNGDMVGHTGIRKACLKAATAVDLAVKKITEKTLEKDGKLLIFADHGNLEDQTKFWRTSHTLNPVPFIFVSNKEKKIKLRKSGGLKDIAPTVLDLLKIKIPKDMSGKSLILKN